jgi:molybdopterin-guanine dinucleotide biosynthesis protein A
MEARTTGVMEKPAGLILAGGAASRIGGEKAMLPFGNATLLNAVIARVRPQLSALALSVRKDDAARYAAHCGNIPLVFDGVIEDAGPLAGIVAGLEWLANRDDGRWLATFPCDTPFLPRDLVGQLTACAHDAPVFARDAERLHGVCALWPLACLDRLRTGVQTGKLRSLQSALSELSGETCLIAAPSHAFFNINTQEDLREAERLAPQFL